MLNQSLTAGSYRCGVTPIDFDSLRSLVVDDSPHMRAVVRALLQGFGASEIYEADDGAAGLEASVHFMPDIVITDWVMPNLDGLEFTRVIRQPGINPDPYVPIIMLSSHTEQTRVDKAYEAGVTQFLAKPITARGLYEAILTVVADPNAFRRDRDLFRAHPPQGHLSNPHATYSRVLT
jgi:two-component system, chemotaxis family, chemotaxis protein CheY